MQIRLNLQIFLFIIVFILTHQIKAYSFLMFFAFVHELGHLITGLLLGLKPKSLKIMPFGVSINFEDYGYIKLHEIKKIIIAFLGPLTNFIIAIVSYILPIFNETKELIIYSNILIGLFNLIPMYPLDGGRILKSIFRLKNTEDKTNKMTNEISNIILIFLTAISSITIIYFKNISILFILMYLWIIIIRENRRYKLKNRINSIIQKNDKRIDI